MLRLGFREHLFQPFPRVVDSTLKFRDIQGIHLARL
jgi:hypothetical protein